VSSLQFNLTDPALLTIDAASGVFHGANGRYEKSIRELEGVYRDTDAFALLVAKSGDDAAYWVESSNTQSDTGGLITGLSVLEPGRVGDEYFMTRGHLHARAECAEMYLGVAGRGVMLLETLDGRSSAVAIEAGQVVYVPGWWIHRSVNVGGERLVTLFSYSVEAGQNYELIARAGGMRQLIVVGDDGGWTTRENPSHLGYRR
jgi:glucose-6-phosphate isomerase, archaeal